MRSKHFLGACAPLVLLLATGCDFAEDVRDRRKLEDLVKRGATRAEVVRELGVQRYDLYEKGTSSWTDLEQFLHREDPSRLRPLRENASKYPKVMFFTTMWRMTWIFLDEKDVIRGYYLAAQ